jgi:hypothetical protein
MKSPVNLLRTAIFCALLLGNLGAKKEENKPRKEGKDHKEEKGAKVMIPIPVGRDAKGIKLPYFDGDGRLQMYFNIDVAKRIDEDHLEMANLKLETFDETGAPEMKIDMAVSVLDLKTKILSSDHPVTIRRSDFEITGERIQFNTETRQGKMTGNVRMLIFDSGDFSGGNKSE